MLDPAKLRDYREESYKEVHDIIFPADVRESDLIRAKITVPTRSISDQEVRVWKLSPLGIELLFETTTNLEKGDNLEVSLFVSRQHSRFEGAVVECGDIVRGMYLVVIRLYGRKSSGERAEERRLAIRWTCSSQFFPVAVAPNPLLFNDFVYLTIRDISASGIRALTSLRNKYLVPDMQLDLQASFPMTGYALLKVRIARTALTADSGKDYLELGLEIRDLSKAARETIGQYLVQFSNAVTFNEIRKSGFSPLSLARGVDYSFIRDAADFLEVLELRLSANRAVGKIPSHYTAADMADAFDSRCRILAAKFRGRIVGTIRMGFVEQSEQLEVESYVTLPEGFPRRDLVIECGRAATHPDYRRADLWYSLVQHAAISALQARRPYGIICTTAELVPMYEKLGFEDTGIRYEMPLYPGVIQHLLTMDIVGVVSGNKVGPVAWSIVWRQVADFVRDHQIEPAVKVQNTRTKVYRFLSPAIRFFASRFARSTKR